MNPEDIEKQKSIEHETIHEGELVTDNETRSKNSGKNLDGNLNKESSIHLVEVPFKKAPSIESVVETEKKEPKTPNENSASSSHTADDEARARQRQKTFLLERRKQKRRQVFYGRLRVLAKFCFMLALAFGIFKLVTAPFWLYSSPDFEVNKLHLLSRKNIEPIIQGYAGQPIYQVDPKQIETILKEKYPIIDKIYVRRHLFPSRLSLMVLEKEPWGELYSSPHSKKPYAVVSDDHELILLDKYEVASSLYPNNTLPNIILPLTTWRAQEKSPDFLKPLFLKRLNEVSYQLSHVSGLTLKYMDARNPDAVDAYFDIIRARLGRLDATRSERLGRLFGLVNDISKRQGEIDDVDLRWLNQVTFHRGKYTLAKPYQDKEHPNF